MKLTKLTLIFSLLIFGFVSLANLSAALNPSAVNPNKLPKALNKGFKATASFSGEGYTATITSSTPCYKTGDPFLPCYPAEIVRTTAHGETKIGDGYVCTGIEPIQFTIFFPDFDWSSGTGQIITFEEKEKEDGTVENISILYFLNEYGGDYEVIKRGEWHLSSR